MQNTIAKKSKKFYNISMKTIEEIRKFCADNETCELYDNGEANVFSYYKRYINTTNIIKYKKTIANDLINSLNKSRICDNEIKDLKKLFRFIIC